MVKVKLELILNENGVTFLNFWDSLKGQDVSCEVKDGKLFEQFHDQTEDKDEVIDEFGAREITLQQFIDKVHEQRKHSHE